MNPKDGKAGSAVTPADPKEPIEAVTAKPGEITQVTGGTPPPPHKKPKTAEEKKQKNSWIEIELVDKDQKPVPGERYRITLPDGAVAEGTLNEKGFARVDGIEPGTCQITFPNLEKEAWKAI
jgi:type VI secretion system secreted protein VgrG